MKKTLAVHVVGSKNQLEKRSFWKFVNEFASQVSSTIFSIFTLRIGLAISAGSFPLWCSKYFTISSRVAPSTCLT